MPTTNCLLAAFTSSLVIAVASPASAGADVSSTPLKDCYLSASSGHTEPVDVQASGFTPGALVEVTMAGEALTPVVADANGAVSMRAEAPFRRGGERSFAVRFAEQGNENNVLKLKSRVSAISVALRPPRADPKRKVKWIGRGFTERKAVYAHYLLNDEVRKTVRVARPHGACGTFTARRRQFPFRPEVGDWIVQIDQQRRFSPTPASAAVRLTLAVQRVFAR
ncbi:MAG: hypothetical protein M3P40_12305 [Actinomycetota bacterium]|nr:hypothetical protein [Actinomycetota bacterium]